MCTPVSGTSELAGGPEGVRAELRVGFGETCSSVPPGNYFLVGG